MPTEALADPVRPGEGALHGLLLVQKHPYEQRERVRFEQSVSRRVLGELHDLTIVRWRGPSHRLEVRISVSDTDRLHLSRVYVSLTPLAARARTVRRRLMRCAVYARA